MTSPAEQTFFYRRPHNAQLDRPTDQISEAEWLSAAERTVMGVGNALQYGFDTTEAHYYTESA